MITKKVNCDRTMNIKAEFIMKLMVVSKLVYC